MPAGYKQIVHTWMFGTLDWPQRIKCLRQTTADGVDLALSAQAAPGSLDDAELRGQLAQGGLPVLSVTPLYMDASLDHSSTEAPIRQKALEFSKRCIERTAFFGCDRMLVSPSAILTCDHPAPEPENRKWACAGLAQLCEYARGFGISLMIEPINRYRVALVHTVSEAMEMIREIGAPNLGIVADTFHANMEEEKGVADAIAQSAPLLQCLHVGDNNRSCPGGGTLNWPEILAALRRGRFSGPLSHEPVFLYFSPARVAQDAAYRQAFVQKLRASMQYLRALPSAI